MCVTKFDVVLPLIANIDIEQYLLFALYVPSFPSPGISQS